MERNLLPIALQSYQLFIFDLDNTLYAENDYLFGAYSELANRIGNAENKEAITAFLKERFISQGRQGLFNALFDAFKLEDQHLKTALEILRNHTPAAKYNVYEHMLTLILALKHHNKALVLLTNGNVQQQKNKIKHLSPDLTQLFNSIVYANEIAPKPAPESILHILEVTGYPKHKTIMIGDSSTDAAAAKTAGIDFMDVTKLDELIL